MQAAHIIKVREIPAGENNAATIPPIVTRTVSNRSRTSTPLLKRKLDSNPTADGVDQSQVFLFRRFTSPLQQGPYNIIFLVQKIFQFSKFSSEQRLTIPVNE